MSNRPDSHHLDSAEDAAQSSAGWSTRAALTRVLRTLSSVVGLISVWALFALSSPESFATWENQKLMLLQTAVCGVAAIGATFIIVAGGIDLSVGSTIALGTVVIALALESGASPVVAALVGLGSAVLCGLLIGSLVVGYIGRALSLALGCAFVFLFAERLGLPAAIGLALAGSVGLAWAGERWLGRLELSPFIVTLGMWGALRGVAKGLGDNQPVYPNELGWIADLMLPAREGLFAVAAPGVWLLFALALVAHVLLFHTSFGRHVRAIGSNEETARLCGVRIERTKLALYGLGIGCAGLAALLQFSYLSIGDPTTAEGYELRVIAAVVIGGASLAGGEGSIAGTLVGALIMTVVDNGCTKLGLDNWVQEIATGVIIVAAVGLDRLRERGRSRVAG